jgi:putative glutathione S-transferase
MNSSYRNIKAGSKGEFDRDNVDILFSVVGGNKPPVLPLREERHTDGIEVVYNAKGTGHSAVSKEQQLREKLLLERLKRLEKKLERKPSYKRTKKREKALAMVKDLKKQMENSASGISYERYLDELAQLGGSLKSKSRGMNFNAQSRGLNLDTQSRGLNLNTQSRGLSLDTQSRGLNLNSQSRGLNLNTQSRGLNLNSQSRGLNLNTQSRGLNLDTPSQGRGLAFDESSDGQLSHGDAESLHIESKVLYALQSLLDDPDLGLDEDSESTDTPDVNTTNKSMFSVASTADSAVSFNIDERDDNGGDDEDKDDEYEDDNNRSISHDTISLSGKTTISTRTNQTDHTSRTIRSGNTSKGDNHADEMINVDKISTHNNLTTIECVNPHIEKPDLASRSSSTVSVRFKDIKPTLDDNLSRARALLCNAKSLQQSFSQESNSSGRKNSNNDEPIPDSILKTDLNNDESISDSVLKTDSNNDEFNPASVLKTDSNNDESISDSVPKTDSNNDEFNPASILKTDLKKDASNVTTDTTSDIHTIDQATNNEKNRYHLFVSHACSLSHRCLVVRALKRLQSVISVSYVDCKWDPQSIWFPKDDVDEVNDVGFWSITGKNPEDDSTVENFGAYYFFAVMAERRVHVPILWDKKQKKVISDKSVEIMKILNFDFNKLSKRPKLNLFPPGLKKENGDINKWLHDNLCDEIYRCGLATSQAQYDAAIDNITAALDKVERIVRKRGFLAGHKLTESDIRLFVILLRFDEVYRVLFKVNTKIIATMPGLVEFMRDIYQVKGVKETCNMEKIKKEFYGARGRRYIIPKGSGAFMNLMADSK